jgi:hypothetical protein
MAGKFSLKMPDFHVVFRWSFTCRISTTWDWRIYFSSERKAWWGFFFRSEKSDGFGPCLNQRTLGSKGQHATNCSVLATISLIFHFTSLTILLFHLPVGTSKVHLHKLHTGSGKQHVSQCSGTGRKFLMEMRQNTYVHVVPRLRISGDNLHLWMRP